jgi:hypothetical protein
MVAHQILSLARLPVPPLSLKNKESSEREAAFVTRCLLLTAP